MKPVWRLLAAVGVFVLPFSASPFVQSSDASYDFVEIAPLTADNNALPKAFGAAINNSGQVSFAGSPVASPVVGAYRGGGGALTTILQSDSNSMLFGATGIDDTGRVLIQAAFNATNTTPPNAGVFAGSGGGVTPLASAPAYSAAGDFAVNRAGSVAFIGTPTGGSSGVFVNRTGQTDLTIASSPAINSGATPSINASNTVAFFANLTGGGTAILRGNGGALTTIADTHGRFTDVSPGLSINDKNQVAFVGFTTDGLHALAEGDGTVTNILLDSSGPYATFANPALNNTGGLAFLGFLKGGNPQPLGIFTGADPVADKVIEVGDTLAGQTVTNVWFYDNGLNDNGQIAFWAQLADGTSGIFRADPVPEPGTFALFSLAAPMLLRRRRA